jgi:hypothetical protein
MRPHWRFSPGREFGQTLPPAQEFFWCCYPRALAGSVVVTYLLPRKIRIRAARLLSLLVLLAARALTPLATQLVQRIRAKTWESLLVQYYFESNPRMIFSGALVARASSSIVSELNGTRCLTTCKADYSHLEVIRGLQPPIDRWSNQSTTLKWNLFHRFWKYRC